MTPPEETAAAAAPPPEAADEAASDGAAPDGDASADGVAPGEPASAAGARAGMRWFVLHVYSSFENQVRDAILERKAADDRIGGRVGEVLVPTEDIVDVRRGKKTQSKRKFFPGYVLVQSAMVSEGDGLSGMDEVVRHVLQNLPKVTGFLGPGDRPLPIPRAEEERLREQVREGVTRARPAVTFEVGERVRVAHGPFASFNGLVEDVDEDRARLKVSVSIFGRSTPVDLEYSQVEKL